MGWFSKLFKKRSKKKEKSVGTVPTTKKKEFPKVKPVESTKDLLKEWTKTLEMVEEHPLSQARVINTALLGDLTRVLNSMDERLGKLAKLDEIIDLLIETKKQLKEADLSTSNVDAVISNLKGLTVKDKEALSFFESGESLTTKEFAERADLSRSTASSRLNRLFSFGLLEKEADGKKILFQLKNNI